MLRPLESAAQAQIPAVIGCENPARRGCYGHCMEGTRSDVESIDELVSRTLSLLDAVISVGRDLDLPTVLRRTVEEAVDLIDCRYGAIGVLREDDASYDESIHGGRFIEFVTTGLTDAQREAIGPYPRGEGILGVLLDRPQTLRLTDLAAHPDSVGFPPNHPPMTSFLGVPIKVGAEVFGNLYLTEKRSGEFTAADEAVAHVLATAAGAAIDRARIYEAARLAGPGQRAMAGINRLLLVGTDTSEVLLFIAKAAREIAGADLAGIAFEDETGTLVATITDSDDARSLPGAPLSWGEPCLVIPLGGLSPAATLCVANRSQDQRFSPGIIRQLQSFADQVVLALELAEARRGSERLILFEDRDRIARDLHDTVIQRLFALGLRLESVSRRVGDEPRGVIQEVVDELDTTIREIRASIYSLKHIERGGQGGLRARVIDLTEKLNSIVGFAAALDIAGPIDTIVADAIADDAVAVLRELLSNAARHASAKHIAIRLSADSDCLLLVVSDDGTGIAVNEPGARRSGLDNIAVRAARLGGTCDVASPSEDGKWATVITWTVPLPRNRGDG